MAQNLPTVSVLETLENARPGGAVGHCPERFALDFKHKKTGA